MATLTVRNVPDDAKHRFRQVAAAHGRSMEEHLRQLIIEAGHDEGRSLGVADRRATFQHRPVDEEPFVSTGSANIDRLVRLGRGIDWQPEPRRAEQFSDFVFDPKDFE